jgi:pimeloyl-ACP methyl ester carboxylesterase
MTQRLALRCLLPLLALPLVAGAEEPQAPARTITHEQIVAKYADADSRFAEVDGVRLHYKDQGKGPAILLIHGSLGDLSDWNGWASVLTQRYRVVRLDLPGFGLSGPIDNGNYSIDRSQSLVDGLMDTLGIERFAIAGVSYGGPVAFRYAATRTDRVTALVIMNSAGVEYGKQAVDPKTGEKEYYKTTSSSAPLTPAYIDQSLRKSFQDPARIPPGMAQRKLDQMNVIGRDREGALMIAQYVRGDPERVLGHVRAPALVLWGGAERSLSLETADRFARALTRAKVVQKVMQEGGDHYMHVELPEPTARTVAAFLDANVAR